MIVTMLLLITGNLGAGATLVPVLSSSQGQMVNYL